MHCLRVCLKDEIYLLNSLCQRDQYFDRQLSMPNDCSISDLQTSLSLQHFNVWSYWTPACDRGLLHDLS